MFIPVIGVAVASNLCWPTELSYTVWRMRSQVCISVVLKFVGTELNRIVELEGSHSRIYSS